jgi:hyperosmotically inducible protein
MVTFERKVQNRVLVSAVAAALALGFAACGEKPSSDRVGQNLERGNAVTPPPNRATDATPRPDSVTGDRMADARKAIDDATLTTRVKTALIAEPDLKSLTINVDTMAGVVTLKGTANSQESRQKAEQVASSIEGVRTVKNELVVVSG